MKHPQHIVAFHKGQFGAVAPLKSGFNHMMIQEFLKAAQHSLFIGRREELEKNEEFGQALPYIVLYQGNANGDVDMFTYQRGKGIGESRLLGNASVGVGGHVDIDDVQHRSGVIDVLGTISNALVRELEEEISFTDGQGRVTPELKPVFFGIINDERDAVGRAHYGLLYGIKVPSDVTIACKEPELLTIGMYNEDALKLMSKPDASVRLEGWSELVVKEFREFNALSNLV